VRSVESRVKIIGVGLGWVKVAIVLSKTRALEDLVRVCESRVTIEFEPGRNREPICRMLCGWRVAVRVAEGRERIAYGRGACVGVLVEGGLLEESERLLVSTNVFEWCGTMVLSASLSTSYALVGLGTAGLSLTITRAPPGRAL
jgi:hypothetical protein